MHLPGLSDLPCEFKCEHPRFNAKREHPHSLAGGRSTGSSILEPICIITSFDVMNVGVITNRRAPEHRRTNRFRNVLYPRRVSGG